MALELLAERALELAALLGAPNPTLPDAMRRFGELRRLLDAAGVDLVGRVTEAERARQLGERSPAQLLCAYAGMDTSEALTLCAVVEGLEPTANLQGETLPPRYPVLAAAMAAGHLRLRGVERAIASIADIEPHTTLEQREAVQELLVEHGAGLTDRQFAQLCRAVRTRYLPQNAAEREEYPRRRSGVRVRTTREGLVEWIVTMHPEAAGFLTTAVDARTAPRRQPAFSELEPERDERTLGQKRLDALVSIARESLAHDPGRLAGASVTMMVTTTLDALRTGLGEAKICGIDEPISAATARRLAADANIIPAVLGGPSERLDLGREVRLATEAQRRALELRDGGCAWWSCSLPSAWCEVAHITPWFAGGATDLGNLMLLCPFHHRRFDNDGWSLEERAGVRYFIPPPWVDPARTPCRAGPLPQPAAA